MKNYVTGRWRGARYGLRIQADLVKLAARHGVEEFLPYTRKKTGERQRRREERGLRIKGTGVGQKVKGRKWERTLESRLDRRRVAMLKMPKMIYNWKRVSVRLRRLLELANSFASLGMAGNGQSGQSRMLRLVIEVINWGNVSLFLTFYQRYIF